MRIRLHWALTLPRETIPAGRTRELLFLTLLPLVMQVAATRVCAQGTITINFSGLATNEVLGEQFAAQGAHFFGGPPYHPTPPITVTAPSVLQADGATVGVGASFGIRFDLPITSLRLDIAELLGAGAPGQPNYGVIGMNQAGQQVGGRAGDFPANQWWNVTVAFTPDQNVRTVSVEGWLFNAENFRAPLYFNNLEAVTVPEVAPSNLAISLSGGNVVLTWTAGVLQSSPALNPSAFTDVTPIAVSPYSIAPTGAMKYFRLRGTQ